VVNIGVYSVGSQARGFFLHEILAPPPYLQQDYEQNGFGEKRGMVKLNGLSDHKMGESYGARVGQAEIGRGFQRERESAGVERTRISKGFGKQRKDCGTSGGGTVCCVRGPPLEGLFVVESASLFVVESTQLARRASCVDLTTNRDAKLKKKQVRVGEKRGMVKLNRLSGHKMGESCESGKRKSAEVLKSKRLRESRERESAKGSENRVRIVAPAARVLGCLTVRASRNSIFVQQCRHVLPSPLALPFFIALASLRAVTSLRKKRWPWPCRRVSRQRAVGKHAAFLSSHHRVHAGSVFGSRRPALAGHMREGARACQRMLVF